MMKIFFFSLVLAVAFAARSDIRVSGTSGEKLVDDCFSYLEYFCVSGECPSNGSYKAPVDASGYLYAKDGDGCNPSRGCPGVINHEIVIADEYVTVKPSADDSWCGVPSNTCDLDAYSGVVAAKSWATLADIPDTIVLPENESPCQIQRDSVVDKTMVEIWERNIQFSHTISDDGVISEFIEDVKKRAYMPVSQCICTYLPIAGARAANSDRGYLPSNDFIYSSCCSASQLANISTNLIYSEYMQAGLPVPPKFSVMGLGGSRLCVRGTQSCSQGRCLLSSTANITSKSSAGVRMYYVSDDALTQASTLPAC
jgi:hypothetical protein